MAQVTFTNHYKAGHSYQETWESTMIHCPKCGRIGVWKDTSGGDYYVGEQHICPGCEFSFHMPSSGDCSDDNDRQRLAAIRSWKAELPTGSTQETSPVQGV